MSTTNSGWRNERIGIIGSASLMDVVMVAVVLAATLLGWFALSALHRVSGLLWLGAAVLLALLMFARALLRRLYRWVSDVALHVGGRVIGTSRPQAIYVPAIGSHVHEREEG